MWKEVSVIIDPFDHDRPSSADHFEKVGPTIRTYSGRYVDPFDLKPDDVCIEDIARALAFQCRFAGHMHTFYSVAEHSLNVAHMILRQTGNMKWATLGLLHDADEAYLPDMVRPVKYRDEMKPYMEAGERAQQVIWDVLVPAIVDREWVIEEIVKEADGGILAWEMAIYRDQRQAMADPVQTAGRFRRTYERWSGGR